MLLAAGLFGFCARDIPRSGLAGAADPGPRALPLAMVMVVAAGGLVELTRASMLRFRAAGAGPTQESPDGQADAELPAPMSYQKFGILAGAVLVYLLALTWLGFQISTVVFVSSVLTWLGARWWSATLSGVVIVLIVRILFGELFHVQLPEGAFGLTL